MFDDGESEGLDLRERQIHFVLFVGGWHIVDGNDDAWTHPHFTSSDYHVTRTRAWATETNFRRKRREKVPDRSPVDWDGTEEHAISLFGGYARLHEIGVRLETNCYLPKGPMSPLDAAEAMDMIREGASANAVARHFNVDHTTVIRTMKANGLWVPRKNGKAIRLSGRDGTVGARENDGE